MEKVLRILHLEDIESDAALVERELRKGNLSFELQWVSNKADFKSALATFHPDIVLSDHSLPGITSIEALNLVKETNSNIPFILITATISEEFAVAIIKDGAADYILKDRMQRLPGAVTSAMEQFYSDLETKSHLQEIIRNENRFRSLIENSGALIGLTGADGKMLYRSPNYQQITGWTFAEMQEQGVLQLAHPDDLNEINRVGLEANNNPGSAIPLCYRFRHKDGHYLWLEGVATNMLHDENLRGFIVNLRDVTTRKISEEAVLRSKANFSAIIENTDAYIHSLDCDLNYITFNAPLKDIMKRNFNVDLVPGMKVLGFWGPDNAAEIADWERIYEIVLSGKAQQFVRDYTAYGERTFISFSINPIKENGQVIGVTCFARDITKEHLAEAEKANMVEQLIKQNNDLMQFSFIASHNLRGPVASILGLVNLFAPKDVSGSSSELLPYLKQAALNMDSIIMDISEILSIRTGEVQVKEYVDVRAVIKSIKQLLHAQIAESNVKFEDHIGDISFYTIKSYFHSILYNLISNAIKFRSPLRPLVVEIQGVEDDHLTCFSVSDNGLGIDLEKFQSKIFGLYNRFHLDVDGKGLGLYIAKTQVEALNGTIEVKSTPAIGSTFTLKFHKQIDNTNPLMPKLVTV